MCFFFKQKTAYEMRISDWSSDVCSSDLNTHTPISNSMGNQEMNKLVRKEGSSRALPETCTPDLTSSGTIQRSPGEVRLYGRPASGVTYSVSTAERRGGKEGGSAGRSRRSAYH